MSAWDLNGAADDSERKRLRRQAIQESKRPAAWKFVLMVIPVLSLVAAFEQLNWASAIWPNTPGSQRLYENLAAGLGCGLAVGLTSIVWKRNKILALMDVLRSARRCIGCGYPIDESPETKCPECGTARGHS